MIFFPDTIGPTRRWLDAPNKVMNFICYYWKYDWSEDCMQGRLDFRRSLKCPATPEIETRHLHFSHVTWNMTRALWNIFQFCNQVLKIQMTVCFLRSFLYWVMVIIYRLSFIRLIWVHTRAMTFLLESDILLCLQFHVPPRTSLRIQVIQQIFF